MTQRVALVTGAMGGLGTAICQELAKAGNKVVASYHPQFDNKDAWLAEMAEAGFKDFVCVAGDVSSLEDCQKMVAEAEAKAGPIDILVNNAAYCPSGPISSYTRKEWDRTFSINVTGAFLASQEFVKRLRLRRAKGKIVNIASQAAFLGSTSGHLPYDSSKGALVSMTRAIAREVAEEGINVNAIAPGMVMTEMVAGIWEKKKDFYLSRIPMKRIAQPEEVASVAVFLASDAASFMTGTTLDVTGGLMMR